jgi:hypothetical protein
MIRPFQLPDFNLLYRLDRHKIPLNAEAALTRSSRPVWSALRDMVSSSESRTYIWKSAENNAVGFVQLQLNDEGTHAKLLYLGSAENGNTEATPVEQDIWLPILDDLVAEVGKLGVQGIVAEAPENGPELPILRRAGYAVYTRQDIWLHKGETPLRQSDTAVAMAGQQDEWDVELLYAHTVPHMIQLVEPHPPLEGPEKWTLRERNELAAYAHIKKNSEASWLRLFVHPNAETPPDSLVAAILNESPPSTARPIYCRLRRGQQWLESALQANGFEYWGSQAVMVKQTVQIIKNPLRPIDQYMQEKATAARSAPMVQKYKRDEPKQPDLTQQRPR